MRYLKWVFGIALLALLLAFSIFKINDPDVMQYLANGRLIFSKGLFANFCAFNYVPHTCQLSYAHEWLFNVISYADYLAGRWNGLELLQVALILATFGGIAFVARNSRYSVFSTGFFIFLAVLIGMDRFALRADLFGTLLAVWFYAVLRFYIENKQYERDGWRKYFPLLLLFVIQLIWANSHGSFVLAFVIVAAYLGAYVIQYLVDKCTGTKAVELFGTHVIALLAVLLITCIASVLNPYGPRAFFDAFNGSSAIQPYIEEWQSPFAPSDYHVFSVTVFTVLLCVAAVALVANAKKLYLADVFIIAVFAYLAVRYNREMALFAIFCAMILPYYLDNALGFCRHFFRGRPGVLRGITFGEVTGMLILIGLAIYFIQGTVTGTFYVHDNRTREFGMGLSENQFPIHAAAFIAVNNLKGNMFNDYGTGEYLNWTFYPARKTFIDAYSFSAASHSNYINVMKGRLSYNDIAKKYHINYFILKYTSLDTYGLIAKIYADSRWKLVYLDELTAVFVANTPQNQPLINTYGVNISARKNYDPDHLPTYHDPVNIPYGFISRGLLLNEFGLTGAANHQFQNAVKAGTLGNYYGLAYTGLGLTYAQLGQTDLAYNAFQKAIKLAPDYAPNWYNLGLYYFNLGKYDQALPQFKKALQINSKNQNANLAIGLIYSKKGDTAKARIYLQRELKLYPHSAYAQQVLNSLPQ